MKLIIRASFKCNLSCEYCLDKNRLSFVKSNGWSYEAPANIISDIVKEYDIDDITFCGHGETVLAKNFKELLFEAARRVKRIEIISNGCGRNLKWWDSLFDEMPDGIEYNIILSIHPSQGNAAPIKSIVDLIKEKNKSRKYGFVPSILCPLSIKDVDKFLEIKENDPEFFYNIILISNIYEKEQRPKLFSLIKYEIKPYQADFNDFNEPGPNGFCKHELNSVNIDMGKDGKLHIFKINHDGTYTNIENGFLDD